MRNEIVNENLLPLWINRNHGFNDKVTIQHLKTVNSRVVYFEHLVHPISINNYDTKIVRRDKMFLLTVFLFSEVVKGVILLPVSLGLLMFLLSINPQNASFKTYWRCLYFTLDVAIQVLFKLFKKILS